MKIRKLKHRVIVTPWVRFNPNKPAKGRRIVRAPLSYWFARSVIPAI